MSSLEVTEILSRFPGPVTFYPSRKKWLLVFAGGALFAAGGYWMIRSDEQVGWFVLIFFGLVALVGALAMLPGAGALTLDRDGFEFSSLFRRSRARWRNVSRFEVAELPPSGHKMVVYDDASQKGGLMAAASSAISGHTSGLPDTYGLAPADLARLMQQWRERALAPR